MTSPTDKLLPCRDGVMSALWCFFTHLQHDYAENEMPAGVYPMCELEHVDWEILVPRIIAAYKRAAT